MNPRDWLRFIFGTGFKRQEREEQATTVRPLVWDIPLGTVWDIPLGTTARLHIPPGVHPRFPDGWDGEVTVEGPTKFAAPPTNRGDNDGS